MTHHCILVIIIFLRVDICFIYHVVNIIIAGMFFSDHFSTRGQVGFRRNSWWFLLLINRLYWMQDRLWDEIAKVHGCYQVLLVTLLLLFYQSVIIFVLCRQPFLPRSNFFNIWLAVELYLFIVRIIKMKVTIFLFLLNF